MELPEALLKPDAYPHEVTCVELIETHMSWVFLTGTYAYKVKKPVRFDFVDFSKLADRERFCRSELDLNRRFAPELYVDVLPIVRLESRLIINPPSSDGSQQAVEWAVQMHQFDPALSADQLLDQERLSEEEVRQFGTALANTHAELPLVPHPRDPLAPMIGNFETLKHLDTVSEDLSDHLLSLRSWTQACAGRRRQQVRARQHTSVRECHGDLHLGNIVRTESGLTAFDCLEFDAELREIDVYSDAAFLFMDLHVRGRGDLAYAFLDAYAQASGDYEGLPLLGLYSVYRSMVRAKVSALRLQQDANPRDAERLRAQIDWAVKRSTRAPGRLIVTCGLSGTGKSFWAKQLVTSIGALRLRTDVLRKTHAGYDPLSNTGSSVAGGIYASGASKALYAGLARLATELLREGETVIIDAANLQRHQREGFYHAAQQVGAECTVLHFTAPQDVLIKRIRARVSAGSDASEADVDVLQWQIDNAALPEPDEPVVEFSTTGGTLAELLEGLGLPAKGSA